MIQKTEVTGEFGWCDLHEEEIDEGTYRWKGCWGCFHFSQGEGFPYALVKEAATELKKSPSTIIRWIKKGKLEGEIFQQGRYRGQLPSPRKYHILNQSIADLLLRS